ncbi:type II toxin-antitoxin system VapC family toxin [Venenivibrio stagnispumantis]|uniref:PIN domain-containing protein n=1 Tax=Venenivibrio stagnispumantis TaxID=407998 RepID=A0AA46AG63_9AQUI|nr:PIN domain-containing protein [Venenivibrio stagnispumantis]MCW4573227.1 PIN domain-containing protein [Venenivibrio stagnispumantis]SMP25068.1 hypothetical protein SAMN06264868_1372 [Venenivibrio stagnispumantis]
MNIKKVFVDANVIIDMFDKNRENCIVANMIMNYCVDKDLELYTSCDLVTTVYYILSKKGKKKALEDIKAASDIFELIPFANEDLNKAIYLMEKDQRFKDLEDTLQYVLAKKEGCDLILTNDKEFYSPDIKVVSISQLAKELNIK